jgi:hypothetical protein
MVEGMADDDERIGKVCVACGWVVCEVDGLAALCMHAEAFLGHPAVWVPLTEPTEARMIRFQHDGTAVDLGPVTIGPVDDIKLAPYEPPADPMAPWWFERPFDDVQPPGILSWPASRTFEPGFDLGRKVTWPAEALPDPPERQREKDRRGSIVRWDRPADPEVA